MPENLHAASLDSQSPYDAWLIVNKTAAVVFVPPNQARNLYDRFRNSGLPCSLLPSHCGADVIDFGNPSADQERRIRSVFASWRKDTGRQEESYHWCVWIALLVIFVWLVSLMAFG